jgi:hypothetical protein
MAPSIVRRLIGIFSSMLVLHLAVGESVLACAAPVAAGASSSAAHCAGAHTAAIGATTDAGARVVRSARVLAPECCSALGTCASPVAIVTRTAPPADVPPTAARIARPASSGASITRAPDPPPPRV